MRVRGDGSCSAQEDGEEEEAEKGGGKGTRNEQKNKTSKLQTSWNNSSRQKERGARNGADERGSELSETEEEENVDTQRARARGSKTQGQTISCKSFLTSV